MPNYQYFCNNCQIQFEVNLKIGDKSERCPHCQSESIIKRIPEFVSMVKENSSKGNVVKKSIEDHKRINESIAQEYGQIEKEFGKK